MSTDRTILSSTGPFSVLAFGKLGASELNYSSDIDLLIIRHDDSDPARIDTVIRRLIHDLSSYTEEGRVYRVDLRLRPHGVSGELTTTLSSAVSYYRHEAALWEIQALLKLRLIAGDTEAGRAFLSAIQPLLRASRPMDAIISNIASLRQKAIGQTVTAGVKEFDVNNSSGGIRDIEFLIQGLLLINVPRHPSLLIGNTLIAIQELHE